MNFFKFSLSMELWYSSTPDLGVLYVQYHWKECSLYINGLLSYSFILQTFIEPDILVSAGDLQHLKTTLTLISCTLHSRQGYKKRLQISEGKGTPFLVKIYENVSLQTSFLNGRPFKENLNEMRGGNVWTEYLAKGIENTTAFFYEILSMCYIKYLGSSYIIIQCSVGWMARDNDLESIHINFRLSREDFRIVSIGRHCRSEFRSTILFFTSLWFLCIEILEDSQE